MYQTIFSMSASSLALLKDIISVRFSIVNSAWPVRFFMRLLMGITVSVADVHIVRYNLVILLPLIRPPIVFILLINVGPII